MNAYIYICLNTRTHILFRHMGIYIFSCIIIILSVHVHFIIIYIYIYSLYYHILIIIILSYYDMLSFVCIQSDVLSYVIWSFIVNIYDLIWYTCSCHSCRSAFFQVTERIQSEALGPVVQVSKVTIVARNAALTGLSEAPFFRFKWRFPMVS